MLRRCFSAGSASGLSVCDTAMRSTGLDEAIRRARMKSGIKIFIEFKPDFASFLLSLRLCAKLFSQRRKGKRKAQRRQRVGQPLFFSNSFINATNASTPSRGKAL